MEMFVNCNTSTLAPYTVPLDAVKVRHLYRRIGFSASNTQVQNAIGQTADALVDSIVDAAINAPNIAPPLWADWNNDSYPEDDDLARALRREQHTEISTTYGNAMLTNGLKDRLSFFWSNILVTEYDVYNCNSFLYYYVNCLQRNAIGNYKTFLSEMGLTAAMLYYLDGVRNNGNNPNENYARELYELFSLGEGNGYTEEDIIETAKALSGYTDRGEVGCSPVNFRADRHDSGTKTIFGQTGNWGYDDVHDILFAQRPTQVATFICTKLYEFFVHPDSNDDAGNAQTIIAEMANTFVANNFEIAPVLRQLFKSEHFFDDTTIGVIIKSPFDLYFNFIKELDFGYNDTLVQLCIDSCAMIGQTLFDPIDVAGWQRDRMWINTNYIIGRWLSLEVFLDYLYQQNEEQFRTLAMNLVGNANSSTGDPSIVVAAIVNKFTPKGLLTDQDFTNALDAFKIDSVPEQYYEPDCANNNECFWVLSISPEVPLQVLTLLKHLIREPEFQLK